MKKNRENILKKSKFVYATFIAFTLCMGFIGGSYLQYAIDDRPVEDKGSWHPLDVAFAQNVSVGNGLDGIENVMIYPLASKSDITGSPYYPVEGTAYEHGDDVDGFDDGEELEGSTPQATAYFICITVQFSNKAYNTTSADWDKTLVKAEITSSDLSLTAEVMEEGGDFYDQDGTTDAKLTFYYDFSDAGDTLTTGETVDIDDVDIYYFA